MTWTLQYVLNWHLRDEITVPKAYVQFWFDIYCMHTCRVQSLPFCFDKLLTPPSVWHLSGYCKILSLVAVPKRVKCSR
jgi:hypothetical protein